MTLEISGTEDGTEDPEERNLEVGGLVYLDAVGIVTEATGD
tara:strand:- start:606 stop:728 length:123 start_codon:yes stop_codon:yes gene_type:complete